VTSHADGAPRAEAGALPDPATFLSGEHGEVGGKRGLLRRAADAALDRWLEASGTLRGIDAAAARTPPREVIVASIYRPPREPPRLTSERHRVEHRVGSLEQLGKGKFENLNELIGDERADWLLIADDDVTLPERFLDRMIALAELFELQMAAPAQSLASHAAWRVTRRRPRSIVRETSFVEIGPVTLIGEQAAQALVPFPPLRYGWGLDLAWAATAAERGWRLGIADALPVRHDAATVGSAYPAAAAIEEARAFLSTHPYLSSAAAQETKHTHRSLPK
jgi:hypothetical protein